MKWELHNPSPRKSGHMLRFRGSRLTGNFEICKTEIICRISGNCTSEFVIKIKIEVYFTVQYITIVMTAIQNSNRIERCWVIGLVFP